MSRRIPGGAIREDEPVRKSPEGNVWAVEIVIRTTGLNAQVCSAFPGSRKYLLIYSAKHVNSRGS